MRGTQRTLLGIFLLVVAWFGWMFVSESWMGSTPSPTPITFRVSTSTAAETVPGALAEAGVISSAWRYRLYGVFDASVRYPKQGDYTLRRGQSYRDIARILALGPARREVEITIVEGRTVDELTLQLKNQENVDPKLTQALIGRSVNRLSFDHKLREDFPFLKDLPRNRSLEGYLFPDTYRVWGDQLPEGLIRKQLQEFGDLFGEAKVSSQSAPLKTLDEAVILASIVEAEVRDQADRRIVAGIFLNRLRDGMALQTDASISYMTGSDRSRSTLADLKIDSPFNTYMYRGLPPAPINSPGKSAIEAVLNPAPTDYLFFLTDKAGKVLYARNLDEHAANRRKAGY